MMRLISKKSRGLKLCWNLDNRNNYYIWGRDAVRIKNIDVIYLDVVSQLNYILKMENEFSERMSNLSDKELLDILNNKNDYQKVAFDTAVNELNKRGFSEKVNPILKEYEKAEEIEKLKLEEQQSLPELYSLKSIVIFSAFFTAICGAFMLSYNFKKLGNSEKSKSALIFGFVYAIAFIILVGLTDIQLLKLVIQLGALAGGFVLVYHFEKFYPENLEGRNKPIWKVLLYAIVISIILIAIPTLIYIKIFN